MSFLCHPACSKLSLWEQVRVHPARPPFILFSSGHAHLLRDPIPSCHLRHTARRRTWLNTSPRFSLLSPSLLPSLSSPSSSPDASPFLHQKDPRQRRSIIFSFLFVFDSLRCYNKGPQTGCLVNRNISPMPLEAVSLRSDCRCGRPGENPWQISDFSLYSHMVGTGQKNSLGCIFSELESHSWDWSPQDAVILQRPHCLILSHWG